MKSVEINSIRDVFGFISTYKIAGVIPLDIIAHIVGGYLLWIIFIKLFKLKARWSFLLIIIIALLKEYYDSFGFGRTMDEHIKDFLFTMLLPFISCMIKFYIWAKESED